MKTTQTETTPALKSVPYWTPAGIVMDDPPPAYVALSNDETKEDWRHKVTRHGYELNGVLGGEFKTVDVMVSEHKNVHLMVEHRQGGYDWFNCFFVRPDDVCAWWLDGYSKLIQLWAQAEQTEAFLKLAKTVVAFVRHGHGEDTIDEDGYWSEDDRRDSYRRRLERLQTNKQTNNETD